MRRNVLSSVACPAVQNVTTLMAGFSGKKLLKKICILISSTNFA
jgi:hypothetical protein